MGSTREKLFAALEGDTFLTLRDLSQIVSISESEAAQHLPHVERTARRAGKRLRIEPASCHACAFIFETRRRYTTPSRCPSCRSERIAAARFCIS